MVLTSVESRLDAMTIAEALVKAGLAACVQVSAQGDSVYRWQSAIQQGHEHFLNIKTTSTHKQAVIKWLLNHHPYDLPEILCLNAEASSAYLEWMRATTSSFGKNAPHNSTNPEKPA